MSDLDGATSAMTDLNVKHPAQNNFKTYISKVVFFNHRFLLHVFLFQSLLHKEQNNYCGALLSGCFKGHTFFANMKTIRTIALHCYR